MSRFPMPYPRYKPSGVESLGMVPSHWKVVQIGRIGALFKGFGGTKDDQSTRGVPCVRYGDLYTSHDFHIVESRSYLTEARARNYTPIEYGDVLFAGSGETIEEIGKSAANLLRSPARCGGDIVVFRPRTNLNARFSGYAFGSPQARHQKSCIGRGITVMHVYGDELKYLSIALPPIHEQAAIVRYLDYVDGRVRRYVAAKRKLIALLEEERQAVIHQAVTRGLDPNVPLKPSGVEWLGDIPANWGIRRLRSIADIGTGERDTIDRNPKGKYPFFVRSQTAERIDSWSFDGEAVLTAGDGVGVGRVFHYVNGRFDYHQRVYRFSGFMNILGEFFYHYFRAMLRHEVLQGTAKSTVDSLRLPMLQNFQVVMPPMNEQSAIVECLNEITSNTEAAITRARRQIELLEEYRTRLIADVVTGKLDVRAAAADLPNEEYEEEESPWAESALAAESAPTYEANLETAEKATN